MPNEKWKHMLTISAACQSSFTDFFEEVVLCMLLRIKRMGRLPVLER